MQEKEKTAKIITNTIKITKFKKIKGLILISTEQ